MIGFWRVIIDLGEGWVGLGRVTMALGEEMERGMIGLGRETRGREIIFLGREMMVLGEEREVGKERLGMTVTLLI